LRYLPTTASMLAFNRVGDEETAEGGNLFGLCRDRCGIVDRGRNSAHPTNFCGGMPTVSLADPSTAGIGSRSGETDRHADDKAGERAVPKPTAPHHDGDRGDRYREVHDVGGVC
jgi:hypothetical protein